MSIETQLSSCVLYEIELEESRTFESIYEYVGEKTENGVCREQSVLENRITQYSPIYIYYPP